MYIERDLTAVFKEALSQFPAVMITGPRQAGKSTFVTYELPEAHYITFDDPLNRSFARDDPNGFLNQFDGSPLILDEIQYVPEILSYIKIRIDKKHSPGRWILTGSQQFHLMKNVSESLAGRIAVLELPPFLTGESKANLSLKTILWNGLFPDPLLFPKKRDLWLKSYVQTYLERDIRQLENIQNLQSFESFVNLSAAYHSQEFHPAKLARNGGVSQPTIRNWVRILEASYLSLRVLPFFRNFGKRIIKTSKFYFADPSLVCYFTRQNSPDSLLYGNMGGALFEGLIVSEAWKVFLCLGKKPELYFWRSHDGLEVDLVIPAQNKLWSVEIKLTATPTGKHVENIERFKKIVGDEASTKGVVVCSVDRKTPLPHGNAALPWFEFAHWLKGVLS